MPKVPFVNLSAQYQQFREEIMEAVDSIGKSGHYVLGQSVEQFEEEFASYCGVKYAVGVGNGSDALYLSMKALGIGPGDEVITAPNSFIASAWTIAQTGASLRFCDVQEDMNICPLSLEKKISEKTKAIMPVHLTGRIAQMDKLREIAKQSDLFIVEDAAQAAGATLQGQKAGSFGHAAGFSLHPLKNLHVHGDGGVVTTNDPKLAQKIKQWRNHGLQNRDVCEFWGINSRLDAIQASIASIKLKSLDDINAKFRDIAKSYKSGLKDIVWVPSENEDEKPIYHRFMVRHSERNKLQEYLNRLEIDTKVNYPIPLHLQPAAADLSYSKGDFPIAESLANTILSLPIYAEMPQEHVEIVVEAVQNFCKEYPNELPELKK